MIKRFIVYIICIILMNFVALEKETSLSEKEFNELEYFIKAEFFSFGHVLHVYDTSGTEVALIREKIFSFLPKFEITVGGNILGTITKQFTFFKENYSIDYKGWSVEGDFLGWDYDIKDNYGACVSAVNKEIFNFTFQMPKGNGQ